MKRLMHFVRSTPIYRILFAILLPMVCAALGFAIGIGIMHGLSILDRTARWQTLPAPPAAPVEFTSISPGCITIRAVDRNQYTYCDDKYYDDPRWEKTEGPHQREDNGCPDDAFPDPPAGADQIMDDCRGIEHLDYSRFALLNDGTIRLYHIQTTNAMSQLGRGIFSLVFGSLGGLILGISLVLTVLQE